MRVFLIGYPGEMGGANTEAWHTVKLWVEYGVDVHLIPTWGCDEAWRTRVDALGCTTHVVSPSELDQVPNLPGSPVVSFCNSQFIAHAERFRELGCPLVWANCMTFMFDHERECFGKIGPADAYVFQSEFQRSDWLTIKSLPASRDAIPWFWNWADRRYAAWWDSQGLPFVQGPNMLFTHSASPRIDAEECALLDAANCQAMFCHSEWYAELIRQHRGPANQSEIVLWPYPIDPWPGEPLPDQYDLLIYAKNGHRPQLLEHLAEVFPRHIQIHYGQYHREQLFEAARRSRACAYLADDDHGPLALQEILLAGCPTVGVRTGASFVRTGETGVVVDRLPPGRQCAESDDDVRALADFMEATEKAQALDRHRVRERAAEEFESDRIVGDIITAVDMARLRWHCGSGKRIITFMARVYERQDHDRRDAVTLTD